MRHLGGLGSLVSRAGARAVIGSVFSLDWLKNQKTGLG